MHTEDDLNRGTGVTFPLAEEGGLAEAHNVPTTKPRRPPILHFMAPVESDAQTEHGSSQQEAARGPT